MIPWEIWGEAAFARARAEEKPIFLHIGATWCHWCHVMDDGTYTHPGVARILTERFVAIRVDTDERPDVNERYNQGGWPSVAVLDAAGEVLLGRTYAPAGELVMLLQGVSEPGRRWSIAPSPPEPPPEPSPGPAVLYPRVEKAFDRYHGGFGDFQKFPHVGVCEWLLDRRLRGIDDGGMLRKTLDGMAGGGLWDAEAGGFFRYATQDDWSEPHHEKLLEDNARLLNLYLRAYAVEKTPMWRARAEGVVRWAVATLWQDAAGAFGGSQDADARWYGAAPGDRGAPPAVDPTIYSGWNGLMAAALVRAAAAWNRPGLFGLARSVGEVLLARVEAGRVARVPGGISGLLTDQAEVGAAFLHLWQRSGERRWRDAAVATLTWARDHLAAPEGGFYDALPDGPGLLRHRRRPMPGNVAMAEAAWRLGALLGDRTWLDLARGAADAALDEGEAFGFMAANACAIRERIDRPYVVVKTWRAPMLRDHVLAHADASVLALALDEGEAERISLAEGAASPCTATACARPARDVVALERSLADLTR
jgi:uncharacterized protein YyaL (SSP411 family)